MTSSTKLKPEGGRSAAGTAGNGHPIDVAAQLLLCLTILLGAFLVALTGARLAGGSGEDLEWSMYVGSFALILPVALAATALLSPPLRRAAALLPVAVLWSTGVLGLLVLARLGYAADGGFGAGSAPFALGLMLWVIAAAYVAGPGRAPAARHLAGSSPTRVLAAPATLLVVLLVFGFPASWMLGPKNLAGALVVAAGGLAAYQLLLKRRVPRPAGIAIDALVVATILLAGNSLGLYEHPDAFYGAIADLHQNFFLGPVNDVLHGRTMLVDTFSQYGAGMFYFLAAWFEIGHVGYGGLSLLSGVLTALELVAIYAIVRQVGGSRVLGSSAAGLGLIAVFFLAPPTYYPSVGGLRYILPYVLLAATVAAARPGTGRWRRSLPPVVLGIAAVWSFEALVYCVAAFGGSTLWSAAQEGTSPGPLLRRLIRALVPGAVAVVAAHVLFALATRVAGGAWPDWGTYLAFLGVYDANGISALRMEPWSPGLVVGGVYLASLAALAVLAARAPRFAREERLPLLALAGMVPFGLASLSYFVGLSHPNVVLPVALPCYAALALWLVVLERRRRLVPPLLRLGAPALAFMGAALVLLFSWPAVKERGPDTPLAMALPDGRASLRVQLERMWRSDPVTPRYTPAAELVRRWMPHSDRALVLASQENTVAILLESHRANVLPVAHFLEDGLVIDRTWPRVRRAVDRLRPGTLMLTEPAGLGLNPAHPAPLEFPAAPLLRRTSRRIRARFRLAFVAGDPTGYRVVRLLPRRPRG
ncbi:MAG: hypothetical protein ACR2J6_02275 [Thermoleophilaceae bacterium]